MHGPEANSEAKAHCQYSFGEFTLDVERRVLKCGVEDLTLRPKSFDVLTHLIEHHGQVVTKAALLEAVWTHVAVTDNSLAQCLVEIRRVLGDDSQHWIRTISGKGYIFVAPVIKPVVEFRQPSASRTEASPVAAPQVSPPSRALAVGGLVIVVIATYSVVRSRTETRPAKEIKFTQVTDQAGRETFPSLSADGKSLVYNARGSGNWDIYFQRVGGKAAINLTVDCLDDDFQPALSPDGEQIAFRSERQGGGIFVMGATGESVRRLTDFGFNPAWSPDGKEIVFSTAITWEPYGRTSLDGQLWVVNASNSEKGMLTNPAVVTDAVQPNWSPHGYRIAYWAVHRGQRDIWTLSVDGKDPVAVTQDVAVDWNPVWSPDGRRLYFASDRAGSMNLWQVSIDERSGKVLGGPDAISTPSSYSGPISISGDGSRIAYVQQFTPANIQKVGFDPVNERVVSQPHWITQGTRQARQPDLSPDGEWLTFSGTHEEIYVIRTDGTELRQLTNDDYKDRNPRWSPEGHRIAFYSNRGGEYDTWLINPDGSALERLTYTSTPAVYTPVWSPDGKRLIYTASGGNPAVFEVAKPWKEQSPKPVVVPPEFGARFQVGSWSPDGRKLAGALLKSDGASVTGLGIYSLESGRLERLGVFGYNPAWLRDSRRLLLQDHRGKVYIVDTQSGHSREIFSVAPNSMNGITLSRDNHLLYFSIVVWETDIWLAILE